MFPQYKNERWATQAQPTGPLVLYLFNWCMNEIKHMFCGFFQIQEKSGMENTGYDMENTGYSSERM